MEDYSISNDSKAVGKVSKATKGAYSKAVKDLSAKTLSELATNVAKDLEITPVKVKFSGQREVRTKFSKKYGKVFEKTQWAISEGDTIKVFKYQAHRKQVVKPLEAVNGLLYEMLKAFDTQVLGMSKSMRTSGYYARFADLTAKLK